MYLDLPIIFGLLQRFPKFKRIATAVGLVIMCLALSLSSLANNTTHLILSQGIAYAIGGSLVYSPTILFLDEWFVKRKGFAFGVMWVSVLIRYDVASVEYTRFVHAELRFDRLEQG